MALGADERTEAPTPRRRREAREHGQVARSQDLGAAILLLAGLILLRWTGGRLTENLVGLISVYLSGDSITTLGDIYRLTVSSLLRLASGLGLFVAVLFLISVVAVFIQVGPMFTLHPLKPSLQKIDPLQGLRRLASLRSVMLAVFQMGKLAVVAAVALATAASIASQVCQSYLLGIGDTLMMGATLVFELGLRLAAALLLIALLDYSWHRYRHERDLRMTKEEVKDELRSMEGDPKLKARRRQIQLQLAIQRLKKDVPRADVVVTNPTHLAIAIQYDQDEMPAPKVIAKGADYVALRIRRIAEEHGIPIVERKPLARALYDAVEVGQFIPERFYRAIAEILAYVYEIGGRPWPRGRDLVGGVPATSPA